MSKKIQETFDRCRDAGKPAFVAYVTAGYPSPAQTVDIMLAMEAGGADIIELGVPFSDPIADGVTLQKTSEVALKHGVNYQHCVDFVRTARGKGLKAPVILMGYFNPLIAIGEEHAVKAAAEAGADGFIVVDAPLEEAGSLLKKCAAHHMSLVPLVTPTTTEDRMDLLSKMEDTFVYCVSVTGVTGERDNLPDDLEQFIGRVRKHTSLPLAVGFGISTRAHVDQIAGFADGVVVGSAISKLIDSKGVGAVKGFIHELTSQPANGHKHHPAKDERPAKKSRVEAQLANGDTGAHQQWITKLPDRFGEFGGMFVPETLMAALRELEDAYVACTKDPSFFEELEALQKSFVGRPTPMYFAKRLTEHCGGAKIWFKREDLAHTGAHKINNTLGQILVAKRLGKKRIVAETGAGQHGVATATVCALLGLDCVVYMGTEDIKRQSLNVFRMKMLGATVIPAETGSRTLKDAVNEAMRDWVTNVRTTYYLIGSALGPHPFPTMVRDFQSVIGREAREQILLDAGRLPDVVIACVGGGSNAIGMFHAFVPDKAVKLIGVEAAGSGIATGKHSASIIAGVPGVLHGMRTYLLQDAHGQIIETHSISAGLDYPGVGPEHCYLKSIGRADYVPIDDNEALDALQVMSRHEGIIPALEPSHAIAYALKLAPTMKPDEIILVNLCGRGDKDMVSVAGALGYEL